MTYKIKQSFWNAILNNNPVEVSKMLNQLPELSKVDLRPDEDQDLLTNGFALVQACKNGFFEIALILLESGADPNAECSGSDQPEFGMPICFAVENEDYALADLLLDYGASVDAYPYCDTPMIDSLLRKATEAGIEDQLVRRAYSRYFVDFQEVDQKTLNSVVVNLFYRVIRLGGEPSISALVREENVTLIKEFLEACPEQAGTKMSYPKGTIFENIVYAASWYGYPDVMELCLAQCRYLFSFEVSKWSIHRAITSHNRDGSNSDYISLIKTQLDFIETNDQVELIRKDKPLRPFYLLADSFCWPNNYGHKASPSEANDLLEMAQLFRDFGFDDYHEIHPDKNITAIERAQERILHPGMREYIQFLKTLN